MLHFFLRIPPGSVVIVAANTNRQSYPLRSWTNWPPTDWPTVTAIDMWMCRLTFQTGAGPECVWETECSLFEGRNNSRAIQLPHHLPPLSCFTLKQTRSQSESFLSNLHGKCFAYLCDLCICPFGSIAATYTLFSCQWFNRTANDVVQV